MEEESRAIARVVVARVCQEMGFDAASSSALDTLGDVLLQYMEAAGAGTRAAAEAAGRTEGNLLDVLASLGDLGADMDGLMRHADVAEHELPFPRALPRLPVRKRPRATPSFRDVGEVPPPHIPAFLPALPDRHTYHATPAFERPSLDPAAASAALAAQRRLAVAALVQLLVTGAFSAPPP